MGSFASTVVEVDAIETHPNADAIEVAVVKRYRSIVRKDVGLKARSRVVYLQESSLLPEYLIKRLGLWDAEKNVGRLSGARFDRISAVKFRGLFSQGICLPVADVEGESDAVWIEGENGRVKARVGDDVSEILGVTKWVPEIPEELLGMVFVAGSGLTVDFDVEDIKANPDVIPEGEAVIYREKLHGVFTGVTVVPHEDRQDAAFGAAKNVLVYSKGMGAKGIAFEDVEDNADSYYVRATAAVRRRIDELAFDLTEPLTVVGETFGPGVQDLHYGKSVDFRMFGACRGYRGDHRWLDAAELETLAALLGAKLVPELYRGPFSWETLAEHTNGKTAMPGAGNIREGVVVTPIRERIDAGIGRVVLKSVSEAYKLRKGGTEYT